MDIAKHLKADDFSKIRENALKNIQSYLTSLLKKY